MSMYLNGLGTAVPRFSVSQEEGLEAARRFSSANEAEARRLAILYRKTGVMRRHSTLLESETGELFDRQSFFSPDSDLGPTTESRMQRYATDSRPLALDATREALDEARTEPGEITHLITVSCSGFAAPGFDIALMKSLPLSSELSRTHVGFMGCHAAMNGLRLAHAIVRAEPSAKVLLCAVELCSLHLQYGNHPDAILSNSLFADGAAAVVCTATPSRDAWRFEASGSVLVPDSEDAMTWNIGNLGFEMTLSSRVPELIATHLRPWLNGWLSKQKLSVDRIPSWAVHPGGPRILQAVGETLALPPDSLDASRSILRDYGNMSSPTILFVLNRLRQQKASGPCVGLGFGPGLVVEAMLLDRIE